MTKAFVICVALATLLSARSAEAHHEEYMQVIAEMAEQVPDERVSCGESTVTFAYRSRSVERVYAAGSVFERDRSPGMATERKSDITIVKHDSAKNMKTWRSRPGIVDAPGRRYNVPSPEIFAVMWCLDIIYTRKEIIYNRPPKASVLEERRKEWSSNPDLQERWEAVKKKAAEVPKGRVVCAPMSVTFSYDRWAARADLASKGSDEAWVEQPGRTRLQKSEIVDIRRAAWTRDWQKVGGYVMVEDYVIKVPYPDIFAVMQCTHKGY